MLKKKFRSFSELKSESTDNIFRNRSWNGNQKIIIFGIGVGVGVAEKRFSESELQRGDFRSRSRVSESKNLTPQVSSQLSLEICRTKLF
jgi:hypothetical protein